MVSRAPLLAASLVSMMGCLGPNPFLIGEDEVSSASESSDGSTDASTTLDTESSSTTSDTTDATTGPASCDNQMLDGNETAVDCGGDCDPCADGDDCLLASDCVSGVCDQTCQTPACDDDVRNGDEADIDCGGSSCSFCELSAFIPIWDDVDARDAEFPRLAITELGEIALSFSGSNEARLRWFQELGAPLTSSAVVGESITFGGDRAVPIVLRADASEPSVIAMVPGMDMMSTSADQFMVEHTLADGEGQTLPAYQGQSIVLQGAVTSESTRAVFVWRQDKQIYLRRRDFSVANTEWIDVTAKPVESDPMQYDGDQPDVTVDADGMIIVAWSRCTKAGTPCSIAVRRFDGSWIDPAPVVVSATDVFLTTPHVAIDAAGRVGLSWTLLDIGDSWAYARILDADLNPEGDPWVLQQGFPVQVDTDVAALDDGSFAYAWADTVQDRVHLRRFVSNDVPKLMNIGDEAPWPATDEPASPALANANHRLVVAWSAVDGSFTQIHGQVLSY